ncbi:MAG: hypothetical protein COA79_05705 [Planctomycetota bacterium]|nr:MAG: hypothetical protein COA79_05705 [Planctomycetota bacterium]
MNKDFKPEKTSQGYYEAMPRPSTEELDKFYKEAYFKEGVTTTYQITYTEEELLQKELVSRKITRFIEQNIPSTQNKITSVEIGCGEGFLLKSCIDNSWDAHAVDYQKEPVEKFNNDVIKNFTEAHPGDYLNDVINQNKKYDVVMLQNVLEHVLDPKHLMTQLSKIIKSTGLIFVAIPNDFSEFQELAQKENKIDRDYWFCPPQHLNYFNDKNIHDFAKSINMEIVDAITDFPIELYLWGNKENYITDSTMGPMAHLARVQLDLFLSRRGLDPYLDFYRSCFKLGLGRCISVLLRPSSSN